jgi:hypothetical protein
MLLPVEGAYVLFGILGRFGHKVYAKLKFED